MNALERIIKGAGGSRSISGLPFEDYLSYFNWQGLSYPAMGAGTLTGSTEEIGSDFEGLVQGAYKGNGIVFACMMARALLFSEARFQFRSMKNGTPGDLFGTQALAPLEKPWTNATTGDLLMRAITDVDLAGNFYAHRPGRVSTGGRLARRSGDNVVRRLRPDWVTIILGSQTDAENPAWAIDTEVVGYVYEPGGPTSTADPILLTADEVAHFAPIPDPSAHARGMSWITPVLREVMGDGAATQHKLKFFEGGGTPNMVVTGAPAVKTQEAFDVWVAKMKQGLEGLQNAFSTLYLQHGAEAKVVGADLKAIDFKSVQGAGETRIAAAAGIPPIIVGLSEGLAAGTYNNYGQARRRLADGTMRPLWRNIAGSLATIIDVPPPDAGSSNELWYDDRHIPFLAEDVKDAAEAQQINSVTVKQLIEAGFVPDTVVKAVNSGDFSLLKHSGLVSVQLQVPGGDPAAPAKETPPPKRSEDDDEPDAGALARIDNGPSPKGDDSGRVVRALLESN